MAIEIRELVIRATVTNHFGAQKQENNLGLEEARQLKKEIMDDCKEWVKDYIRDLKSR